MITKINCGAIYGVDAFKVTLEVDFSKSGMPAFTMVGLAEGAVKESRERVFAALKSSSFSLSPARITINLAPADRKKGGTAYDLPLAIGLITASGGLPSTSAEGYFFAGELSLSGEVRPVDGVLPLAVLAKKEQAKGLVVSLENAKEASIVEGLTVYGVKTLSEAALLLSGKVDFEPFVDNKQSDFSKDQELFSSDFLEVKGQEHAKRAIVIAASGRHNLLMLGPPGSGKTMLTKRIPSILPELSFQEALEVTKIYSVAGLLNSKHGLFSKRPFRSPHHSISEYGLIGGGAYPKPGEISLAHRGVLFLDELLEFKKHTLETLRQPLEEKKITLTRAAHTLNYPADIMLVAAMNPCPCGYLTDKKRKCTCSTAEIHRYRGRLSGPLLDRIDLHIEIPAVDYEDLRKPAIGASSSSMREQVATTRKIQEERYANTGISSNSELSGAMLEKFCKLNKDCHDFLSDAVQRLALSARAYTRILKISRTIADIENKEDISLPHIAEAINFRVLDRPY